MEQIKKYTNFLGDSYPRRTDEERHSFQRSGCIIPKDITQWWVLCSHEFAKYIYGSVDGIGIGLFTYIKGCQYSEKLVEESEGKMRKELCIRFTSSMVKLKKENQELNSLIYGMLDEINELKEHNKCLSERILTLENKPPLILY
jgi:hypothetical protein